MKAFRLKRTRTRVHQTQRYPLYAALATVLVLAVVLGIVWNGKNKAEAALERGREQLVTAIQTDLNTARRIFDKSGLPGANVRSDILPDMSKRLYAADMLNRVMNDIYGESALDNALFQQIQSAIDGVDQTIVGGQSPTEALATLASRMNQIETDLNARFADSGLLLSRTALK